MKNIRTIITLMMFILLPLLILADNPGPPPPPGQTGGGPGGGSVPVGAPIDGGLGILLALGIGYGGKKIYDVRKKQRITAETEE